MTRNEITKAINNDMNKLLSPTSFCVEVKYYEFQQNPDYYLEEIKIQFFLKKSKFKPIWEGTIDNKESLHKLFLDCDTKTGIPVTVFAFLLKALRGAHKETCDTLQNLVEVKDELKGLSQCLTKGLNFTKEDFKNAQDKN